MKSFNIALLPGDGIGQDITKPSMDFVQEIAKDCGVELKGEYLDCGAYYYAKAGVDCPEETYDFCDKADAIYLCAMGNPDIRYPDGREIAPQIELRKRYGLYAGVRPCWTMPNAPLPLKDPRAANLDFIVVRESTEGFFYDTVANAMDTEEEKYNIARVTRSTTEKLYNYSFKLAEKRKKQGKSAGKVTCLNKSNIFSTQAFMQKIFDEIKGNYPGIETDYMYVDACAMNFVRKPWTFDVCPVENAYGDVLTDLTAALMGGLGMAPSGEIGDNQAVFQPCHGSAPKMAGTHTANPTAMVLSGSMMLDYLADKFDCPEAAVAAAKVMDAVKAAYTKGLNPHDFGGHDTTEDLISAFRNAADKL